MEGRGFYLERAVGLEPTMFHSSAWKADAIAAMRCPHVGADDGTRTHGDSSLATMRSRRCATSA